MKRSLAPFLVAACFAAAASAGAPTDTTFTYQGELREDGQPADGSFDLEFALFDAPSAGSQIGSTIMIDDVVVAGGVFAVELDFGAEAFDNTGRWLEITVEGFTLSPRQPISRSPYSIQTRGIFVDQDENVGIGTRNPKGALHVAGQYYGLGHLFLHAFEGDGASGTAYIQARDDSGSSSINLRLRTQLNGQITNAMSLSSNGRVGIGTTAPQTALHVVNPVPLLYLQDSDSTGAAQTGYVSLRDSTGSERGWFGYGSSQDTDLSVVNLLGDIKLTTDGEVTMGPHGMHPAFAYGKVDGSNGALISGSSNIISVVRVGEGDYRIRVTGGVDEGDVIVASAFHHISIASTDVLVADDRYRVNTAQDDFGLFDSTFSFVVYRP